MKLFPLSALALLAIASCSSLTKAPQTTASADLTPEAFKEWTAAVEDQPLATSIRNPAQVKNAVSYVWEANSIKVTMKSNQVFDQTFDVKFSQYSMYTTHEQRPVPVQKWVTTGWTQVNQPVLVCAGNVTDGAGKSALWDKFYSAPKAQKSKALADAVLGIGDVSAEKLIAAGFFTTKPRSWDQFAKSIRSAKEKDIITGTVEYQVLYKYRSDNLTNLGYDVSSSSVCVMTQDSYLQPIQELRTVNELRWMDIPHKDLINQDVKRYRVVVTNPKLQDFETEVLSINFQRAMNNISYSVEGAYYTNYQVSFNGLIKLQGVSRKFVPLPDNVFVSPGTLTAMNGEGGFFAPVNKRYVPKTDQDGKLLMSVEIHSCKRGMFGKCAVLGRSDKTIVKTVIAVGQDGVVRTRFPRNPNLYYYARYWVNTAGSPWYSRNVVTAPYELGL